MSSVLYAWTYPSIDPVILDLPGPLALRWYGMMYLVAFWVGFHILRRQALQGRLAVPVEQVGEIVGWIAAGVFLGGRLGYILFYQPEILSNPARILAVWEGGLSFHGGLFGVIGAVVLYSRRIGQSFLGVADGLVLATPTGIFAVRCANFINGELYGRVTTEAVPWAMRFPTDPVARQGLGLRTSAADVVYAAVENAKAAGTWDALLAAAPLRHPSQLYEALTEGALLMGALWLVVLVARKRSWRLPQGTFFALFLLGYAAARSLMELYRQPDVQFTDPSDPIGYVLGSLTMGQVLSLGLAALGAGTLIRNFRRSHGRDHESPDAVEDLAWAVRPIGPPLPPTHGPGAKAGRAAGGGSEPGGAGGKQSRKQSRKQRKKRR